MPFTCTEEEITIPFRHPFAVENEYDDDIGIKATMCVPSALDTQDNTRRSQRRVVVLIHGQGGHRNYVYQKKLSHSLVTTHGLWVFKYDARNAGDSQYVDGQFGFTSQAEIADISTVMGYLAYKRNLPIAAIVTHSRATQAAFIWALLQQTNPDGLYVPSIVNCSGRFRTSMVLDYMDTHHDGWRDLGDFTMMARRFGKRVPIKATRQEMITIAGYDMDLVKYLRPDCAVLSIHGTDDDIVPVEDAHIYNQLLGDRSTLEIIEGADHSYFMSKAKNVIGGEHSDPNVRTAVPRVVEIITKYLSVEQENERFYKAHARLPTGKPRFIHSIDGLDNIRDIGGFPVRAFKNGKRQWIKTGLVYRAAKLDNVTKPEQVAKLGIKQTFDLRSQSELKPDEFPPDGLFHGPGITTKHIALFEGEDYSPEAIAVRYQNYAANGFKKAYSTILEAGAIRGFRDIFEYIRDHPGEPILFNCMAGKDRTGVFAMLLLLLMGAEPQTIAHEYELTTRGQAEQYKQILKLVDEGHFENHLEKKYHNISPRGWRNFMSSRFETMMEIIDMFNRKYGGIEHYLVNVMGLSYEDLDIIRENLLYDGEPKVASRTWSSEL